MLSTLTRDLPTGSVGTIGQAMAECFAVAGANLLLVYNRTEPPGTLKERCLDLGASGATFMKCNVAELSQCEDLVRQVSGVSGGETDKQSTYSELVYRSRRMSETSIFSSTTPLWAASARYHHILFQLPIFPLTTSNHSSTPNRRNNSSTPLPLTYTALAS